MSNRRSCDVNGNHQGYCCCVVDVDNDEIVCLIINGKKRVMGQRYGLIR